MILQALYDYYEALSKKGEISPPGWCSAKVSFALNLDLDGSLQSIISLKNKPEGTKKEIPQILQVPEQVKKTSGVSSNFLCENSSYFLGLDGKGKPERAKQCLEAASKLHTALLSDVDSPIAKAILLFFQNWNPDDAENHPILIPYLDELKKGGNFIFSVQHKFAQEDPAIRDAWQRHLENKNSDTENYGRCLVTGVTAPIARLHPNIKGVNGAQSSGASLVSFNAPAFESFGHEQGFNSPVSEQTAFAYGTVLNRLLADWEHVQYIGDTAVICWSEDAEPLNQTLFMDTLQGSSSQKSISNQLLWNTVSALANGKPVEIDGIPLNPDNRFYVLGLAPSSARLSVRFFLQNTFGHLLKNMLKHQERLSLVKPSFLQYDKLPLWTLLKATTNSRISKVQKPSSPMAGAVLRAILNDDAYPTSLYEQTLMRMRAEQGSDVNAEILYVRTAIIKAFLRKNTHFHVPEEVLDMELNEQSNYLPYVLGRLFAVLERVQVKSREDNRKNRSNYLSSGEKQTSPTIKDKYFNSASATPATIFPLLTKLSQSHLRKLDTGWRIRYEKMITDLEGRIHETLPSRLSLAEQGAFHLGYYHQVQKLYEKKSKEEPEHA